MLRSLSQNWTGAACAALVLSPPLGACGNAADSDAPEETTATGGESAEEGPSDGGSENVPSDDTGGSSNGGSGGRDGGGSGGTETGSGGASSDHCPIDATIDGCSAERVAVHSLRPLDLYLMLDISGSMATVVDEVQMTTRLDGVRLAIRDFLASPATAELGVGLGYFGDQPLAETSCTAADYQTPAVPIDGISVNRTIIEDSLVAAEPTGETPTPSAIEGACNYARSHQIENPERDVAILLVTDGEPQAPLSQCVPEPTTELAADAATACLEGSESLATYVLGIGPSLESLDAIALAGGTESARLVSDAREAVSEGLDDIRDAPGNCTIPLPQEVTDLDPTAIRLVHTNASCTQELITHVPDASACDTSTRGWHPSGTGEEPAVVLCPASCLAAREAGAEIHFARGCTP